MANRYWVGGTGAWTDTSHWSSSSGGSGGASVPASNDITWFDSASSSGNYTVSDAPVTATLNSLYIANPSGGVVSFSSPIYTLNLIGFLTFETGFSGWAAGYPLNVNFSGSSSSTLDIAPLQVGTINVDKVFPADIVQVSNCSCTNLNIDEGVWEVTSYNLTVANNVSVQPGAGLDSSLNLAGSYIQIGGLLDFTAGAGNAILNASSSFVRLTNSDPSAYVLKTNGQVFNTLAVGSSSAAASGRFSGSFTAVNLQLINGTYEFESGSSIAADALVISGASSISPQTNRCTVKASSETSQVTFNASSTFGLAAANLGGINYQGVAPGSPSSVGDLGGNTGLSSYTDAPQNIYWMPTSSTAYSNTKSWSSTSGGSINTSLAALPQFTMVFDNNSPYRLGLTGDVGSLDSSGRTGSVVRVVCAFDVNMYGNMELGTSAPLLIESLASVNFVNKYVDQTVTANGARLGGVVSGASGFFKCDKPVGRSLTFTDAADFGVGSTGARFSVVSGSAVAGGAMQARVVSINANGELDCPYSITLNSNVGAVWNMDAGGTYSPGANGYIWAYNSGSTCILNLGDQFYNKVAINGDGAFTLNVADSPEIRQMTTAGDVDYGLPGSVTFSGSGTALITSWDLNGSSTLDRLPIIGALGAQVDTDADFPQQGSYLELTSLPAAQADLFYANQSIDGGGNTNWIFAAAPPRSTGFMVFF